MAKSTGISEAVTKAVFLPTALEYVFLVVGYPRTGLALYAAFLLAAYLVGAFRRVFEWPLIAKITLACGPPLMGLGYYFSMQDTTYAMYAPGVIYLVLSLAGGVALRRFDRT